jgi:chemotaxis protein MotB
MVEPSWWPRTSRLLVVLGVGSWGMAGCSYVPKTRLDDCHRLSQALQAENSRLKDTSISLRAQNQDLNQRAVDEARRLRSQEEEIQRLVQSVTAYQDEREQMAAALERIKAQVRTSAAAGPVTSGLLGRLEDLARAHPGWAFDPERGLLTIPAGQLFEAGTDVLRPEAQAWLRETAAAWGVPEARDVDLLVVGRNDTSPVRRAGLTATESRGRPLGHDRAARVRDLLAAGGTLDAGRIEVAGFEVPHPGDVASDEASQALNRRIEIHLRRRDDGPSAPLGPTAPATADRSDP